MIPARARLAYGTNPIDSAISRNSALTSSGVSGNDWVTIRTRQGPDNTWDVWVIDVEGLS